MPDPRLTIVDAGQAIAGARRLRAAERLLRADPEELRAIQNERFQTIMQAALRTVPYQRLYAFTEWHGGIDDLGDLPLLDREYLASFPLEERQSETSPEMVGFSSSGSSGTPLRMAWSKEEDSTRRLLMVRQWRAQGLPNQDPFVIDFSGRRSIIGIVINGRTVDMSVVNSPTQLADAVRSARATMLAGDPSLLVEVAEALVRYPLQGLVTGGEVLDPQTRSLLEDCFGVPPRDYYGSREGGPIAWECPTGDGYHVNADAVVVEVLDDAGDPVPDGTDGEVVITNLWNRTCPIVRYRTSDIAALLPGECRCDVRFPLVGQVQGRRNDWIVAPDGRRVSPMRMLLYPLMGWEPRMHVTQYKVVQRSIDDFLVQVRWMDGRREDLVERIRPFYEAVLEASVNVEVQDVDVMPRSRSGKFRVVESYVS